MKTKTLSSKQLLLIDDNNLVLMAHLSILRDAGYAVDTATNGKEAISKFTENSNYDVILTDYHMPEMTGSEVAKNLLRQHKSKKPLILIAITSEFTPEIEKNCLASGINAVMKKPLVLKELLNVLNSQN
jgi:CheY-like chemotaxis protein